jgi:hypothetical protein
MGISYIVAFVSNLQFVSGLYFFNFTAEMVLAIIARCREFENISIYRYIWQEKKGLV